MVKLLSILSIIEGCSVKKDYIFFNKSKRFKKIDKNHITHIKFNDIMYVTPTSMKSINRLYIIPIFRIIATILSAYVSFDYIANK